MGSSADYHKERHQDRPMLCRGHLEPPPQHLEHGVHDARELGLNVLG